MFQSKIQIKQGLARVQKNSRLQSKKNQFHKSIKSEELQKFKKSQRLLNTTLYQFERNKQEIMQDFGPDQLNQETLQILIRQENIFQLSKIINYKITTQIEQIFWDTRFLQKICDLIQKYFTKVESILLVNKLAQSSTQFFNLLFHKQGLIEKIVKQTINLKQGSKIQQIYLGTIWSIFKKALDFQQSQSKIQKKLRKIQYLVQQITISSQYWTKFLSLLSMFINQNTQFNCRLVQKIIMKYKMTNENISLQKLQIYIAVQNMIFMQTNLPILHFKDLVQIIIQSKQNLEIEQKDHKKWYCVLSTLIEKNIWAYQKLSRQERKQYLQKDKVESNKSYISYLIQLMLDSYPQLLLQCEVSLSYLCFLHLISKSVDFVRLQEFYQKYQLVQFLIDCFQQQDCQIVFLALQIFQGITSKLVQCNVSSSITFFQHLKSRNIKYELEQIASFRPNKDIQNKALIILQVLEKGPSFWWY